MTAKDRKTEAAKPTPTGEMPAAGPHAKERLIDREKTPGTGALPEKEGTEADVGPD